MKIPGVAYIIIGALISVYSAIVYKTVPKNGEPNMAMAFFFFVGMIFILVGVVKLFFRKPEDTNPMVLEQSDKRTVQAEKMQHMNRVEQQINKLYQEQNAPKKDHTNTYSHAHQYHGPQELEHPKAAQHHDPKNQHISQNIGQATHHASSQMHHQESQTRQTPSDAGSGHQQYVIVECKKCKTKNYSHSNYCHNCGNRLR